MIGSGRPKLAVGAAVLLGSLGCAYYGGVQERPTWTFTTHRHFGLSVEVRASVLMGDLDAARVAARRVESHPTPSESPPELLPYLNATRRAAGRVAAATTISDAATAAAEMARSCGACHTAGSVGPRFVLGPPPEQPTDLGHPRKQLWAVVRLWQGLVAPSDSAWSLGARTLAELPLDASTLARLGGPPADAPALAARMRSLVEQAGSRRDPYSRAEVVAGFLTTCGECHQRRRGT